MSFARALTRRKLETVKSENIALFRFLTLLLILSTPIILIVAPLPGYLILSKAMTSAPFAVGCVMLLALGIVNVMLAGTLISKKEHQWLEGAFGGSLPWHELFYLWSNRSSVYLCIAASGFTRAEGLTLFAILRFVVLIALIFVAAFYISNALTTVIRRSKTGALPPKLTLFIKFQRLLLEGARGWGLAWLVLGSAISFLATTNVKPEVFFGYYLLLTSASIFALTKLLRSALKNIEKHNITLRYFSHHLPCEFKKIARCAYNLLIPITGVIPIAIRIVN
ncbi:hypothetical protein [Neiella marina]|uniref:hypothetical protein n=1 Tax=Neiella marina TaxID=508461 RepID=UPI000B3C0E32|nr:hypothetical protein [Neiella marina]